MAVTHDTFSAGYVRKAGLQAIAHEGDAAGVATCAGAGQPIVFSTTPSLGGATIAEEGQLYFSSGTALQKFGMWAGDAVFDGTTDHILNWGYNVGGTVGGPYDPTEPVFYFAMESNYDAGANNLMEWHLNYSPVVGSTIRPLSIDVNRVTHESSAALRGNRISFAVSDGSPIPVDLDFSGTTATKTMTITPMAADVVGLTVLGALNQTANLLDVRHSANVPVFSVLQNASAQGILKLHDETGNANVVLTADPGSVSSILNNQFLFARPTNGGQVRLYGANTVGAVLLETTAGDVIFQMVNVGVNAIIGDNRNIEIRPNGVAQLTLLAAGGINVATVPEYADNAAAVAGGKTAGYLYRTGDVVKVVHA